MMSAVRLAARVFSGFWIAAYSATFSMSAAENISPPQHIVGAWRLVSWESRSDGDTVFPFGTEASGLLLYSGTGQMSVFLSQPNREHFRVAEAKAGTQPEKAAAFDSCFAYCGTYVVRDGRVVHRIQHCTYPNWVGTEQVRSVRFEGDRLILGTPPLPQGNRRAISQLVWERIKP